MCILLHIIHFCCSVFSKNVFEDSQRITKNRKVKMSDKKRSQNKYLKKVFIFFCAFVFTGFFFCGNVSFWFPSSVLFNVFYYDNKNCHCNSL